MSFTTICAVNLLNTESIIPFPCCDRKDSEKENATILLYINIVENYYSKRL